MSNPLVENEVALPPLERARRVHLVFHPFRTRLVRWQSSADLHGLRWAPHGAERPAHVLTLDVLDPAEAPENLVVRSEGPAQLVATVVEEQDGTQAVHTATGVKRTAGAANGNGGVLAPVPSTAEYLEELWSLLESQDTPRTPLWNYRRFFADLDRHTDPGLRSEYLKGDSTLLGRMEIHEPVVRATLWDRISHRHRSPSHRHSRPPYPGVDVVREDVRFVSELMLSLLSEHIGTRRGLIDVEGVHDAFEMFANGELRLALASGLVTTQPSSGLFFFFGEFALLAAECEIDAGVWTRLASAMIASQEIFCRVYAPRRAKRREELTLNDYVPENYSPARVCTTSEKLELRRYFVGRSLDELCVAQERHLARYAFGTLEPVRKPLPEEHGRLGKILESIGALSEDQAARTLESQKNGDRRRRFGDIALDGGLISPAQLHRALELQRQSRGDAGPE